MQSVPRSVLAGGRPIEPAVATERGTLVVAAALPRIAGWLSDDDDSLIRFRSVPILFVPETTQGASS